MSLEFLKVHYIDAAPIGFPLPGGRMIWKRVPTACGREAPDWARKTTGDEDFVTCKSCLDVLVERALRQPKESKI